MRTISKIYAASAAKARHTIENAVNRNKHIRWLDACIFARVIASGMFYAAAF